MGALLLVSGFAQRAGGDSRAEPMLISARVDANGSVIMNQMVIGDTVVDTTTKTGQALLQIREREQARITQTHGSIQEVGRAQIQERNGQIVQAHAISLIETAELVEGEVGEQVRRVANDLKEAAQLMAVAENRVEVRGGIARLFFGSDRVAVNEMKNQMDQSREHIQEMEQLMTNVTDEAVHAMIQEQIQNMETRLEQVAVRVQTERQDKGLFGFLFRN